MEPITTPSPATNPPSPLPPEAVTRAKNIEAVKGLLSPEEWAEVREAAYAERAAEREDEVRRLKVSIGRLYGHFSNLMAKWGIPALNTFSHRPSPSSPPLENETGNNHAIPDPKPKGRTFYSFNPSFQELVPVVPPSSSSASAPEAPPGPRRTRKNAPKPEEVEWRRSLIEQQLKVRPSTFEEVIARLAVEGFPVEAPYYREKTRNRSIRLRALVRGDLSLLVYNGAARRDGKRYVWLGERPDRYRYRSYHKNS